LKYIFLFLKTRSGTRDVSINVTKIERQ